MQITEENRLALEILKAEINKISPETDFSLAKEIYIAEMEHQFDHDRTTSQRIVAGILEQYVETQIGEEQ